MSVAFDLTKRLITDECINGLNLYNFGLEDSEELKSRQEQATVCQVEKYYLKAKEIISMNWEFFEKIARELAEKKILHSADVQRIKAECKIVSVSV